jgi:hypothetical protein
LTVAGQPTFGAGGTAGDAGGGTLGGEGGIGVNGTAGINGSTGAGANGGGGVSGHVLGGGYGYLARPFGLACDNLLSIDLIDPQGNQVTADAQRIRCVLGVPRRRRRQLQRSDRLSATPYGIGKRARL